MVEFARKDEQMEWVAELTLRERRQSVGDHERLGTAGTGDDDSQPIEFGREPLGGDVGAHVSLFGGLDIEIAERVEPTIAVVFDGPDDTLGDRSITVRKGDRRRLAEAIVLEAGERARGGLSGRSVDDPRLDVTLVGTKPEIRVRRRDYRIASDEKHCRTSFGRIEDRCRLLFDARPIADVDGDLVVGFELFDRGSDEPAGVELGEDPVSVPECFLTLDRDRALVVETEPDEGEHWPASGGGRIKRLAPEIAASKRHA